MSKMAQRLRPVFRNNVFIEREVSIVRARIPTEGKLADFFLPVAALNSIKMNSGITVRIIREFKVLQPKYW